MKRSEKAFTLMEIMVVVIILGILAGLVIGKVSGVTDEAKINTFAENVKTFASAAEYYYVKTGSYLVDSSSGTVPAGFEDYIEEAKWTRPTPVGGVWDTEYQDLGGFTSCLGVHFDGTGQTQDDAYMTQIDILLDDGDLTTGSFQKLDTNRYYYILKE